MIRKWLCLMLSIVLAASVCSAFAEVGSAQEYLYSFETGPLLQGSGAEKARELLGAVQIRFYREKTTENDRIRLDLVSEGENAFSLMAGENGDTFSLLCSLLGGNTLILRREQLTSFLLTLVKALGEQGYLKGSNLEKMIALADRAGKVLGDYLNRETDGLPETGLDLEPYIRELIGRSEIAEEREILMEEWDPTGAVRVISYRISEEERSRIIGRTMDKVIKVPVIGDQLTGGTLRIGDQVITDGFIRSAFGETPGEVTMDLWLDAEGRMTRLLLRLPDLSGVVTDPAFSQVEGVELSVKRTEEEGSGPSSVTTVCLPGLEGDLVAIRMERRESAGVPGMKSDKVYDVGDMSSGELAELIRSMSWTIIGGMGNMILTLPRCVAEMLIQKILK